MGSGTILWAFLLLLPAVHLGLLRAHTGWLHLALLHGPLLVLLTSAMRGSALGNVFLFPCSMLPILIAWPELSGPRIYGPAAAAAVGAATLVHLYVSLRGPIARVSLDSAPVSSSPRVERSGRLLVIQVVAHTLAGLALGYTIYFHRPIQRLIADSYPGYERLATSFIGLALFAVWAATAVVPISRVLGAALLDRDVVLTEWYRFQAEATSADRAKTSLLLALLTGAASAGALVLVLLLGE